MHEIILKQVINYKLNVSFLHRMIFVFLFVLVQTAFCKDGVEDETSATENNYRDKSKANISCIMQNSFGASILCRHILSENICSNEYFFLFQGCSPSLLLSRNFTLIFLGSILIYRAHILNFKKNWMNFVDFVALILSAHQL